MDSERQDAVVVPRPPEDKQPEPIQVVLLAVALIVVMGGLTIATYLSGP